MTNQNITKSLSPTATVITTVLNDAKPLEKTILSVINQSYKGIEYIIIDGGSTDGTLDVIAKYKNFISQWISEPDHGIADAFNKGVKNSTGDFINFQGAGDTFVDNDTVENMLKEVDPAKDMYISGRVNRVALDHKIIFTTKHKNKFYKQSLLFKMSLPHQGLFTNRKIFKKFGLFNTDCIFSMDYELILRTYHDFPGVITKNIIVSNWMEGGIGTDRTLEILTEYDNIKQINHVAPETIIRIIKYWSLLKFYIKKLTSLN